MKVCALRGSVVKSFSVNSRI